MQTDKEKETCEKIEKIFGSDEQKKQAKILDDNIREFINDGNTLELSKALLNPVKEVMEYESTHGKICTKSKIELNGTEIKVGYDLNLYESDLNTSPIDKLARIQDRGRQNIIFQEDKALIDLLRKKPKKEKNITDAFNTIIKDFAKRELTCDYIFIPRSLVSDIVNECSNAIDPVRQRDLIMAGYIGGLRDSEPYTQIITTAGTLIFELTAQNELFGINKDSCKRKVISDYKCIKKANSCFWEATIQFELLDKDNVVWVELDKGM
ncbi:MAG TPA: hypothetical protein VMX17_15755 [Candidatus Glassbacteria bacterium]|nr:hypothetical protein [Candidatus Glassbacteria bacterium]